MFRRRPKPIAGAARRPESSHPDPATWPRRYVFHVGGLNSVGFGEGTELLLVTSSAGRGVFDCTTGERVARDREDSGDYEDSVALTAQGIGPLEGEAVRMSGRFGGGLTRCTNDGWVVDPDWNEWPIEAGLVLAPDAVVQPAAMRDASPSGVCRVQPGAGEHLAFGFSPSGRTLVIASSADVQVYNRD